MLLGDRRSRALVSWGAAAALLLTGACGSGDAGGGSDSAGAGAGGLCTGVAVPDVLIAPDEGADPAPELPPEVPPDSDFGDVGDVGDLAADAPEIVEDAGPVCDPRYPLCPGAEVPRWALEDFQPQSCSFGRTYGLDVFAGRTLVVALLSAWCAPCLERAARLEQLNQELALEGYFVHFAAINVSSGLGDQEALIDRCGYPLFQDTVEVRAWQTLEGGQDDIYVYDRSGALFAHLPGGEPDLLTDEGYEALRETIIDAETAGASAQP